jgi:RNA polymerase sigma-70 factor (ECF subfamily)
MQKQKNTGCELTDLEISSLIKRNDDLAFDLLYKKYWAPLKNFAAHYLNDNDSCEEIVQELFVQLHVKRIQLNIKTSMSAYLYAALRNRIFNQIRKNAVYNKHMTLAVKKNSTSQNNVEQFVHLKQLQQQISFSLSQMPTKYREVYMLHDQNNYTVKKISAILQRPADTVEKQLRKATKILRDHLVENKMCLQ